MATVKVMVAVRGEAELLEYVQQATAGLGQIWRVDDLTEMLGEVHKGLIVDLLVLRAPSLNDEVAESELAELSTSVGRSRILVVCNNASHHGHYLNQGAGIVCTERALVEALMDHFATLKLTV